MAEASVVQVPNVTFRLKIGKVSALNEVTSPGFSVQGFSWYVRIKKVFNEGKHHLGCFVFRKCVVKSQNLPVAASVSVKLQSWDENQPTSVQFHLSSVFDVLGTGYGTESLIEWDELFSDGNNYVLNDSIELEINLQVADPNDQKKSKVKWIKSDRCCEMGCVTTILFGITNIENLIAVRSQNFPIQQLDWSLTAFRDNLHQFGICLHSKGTMKCKANMSVKILSSKIQPKITEQAIASGFDYFVIENAASMDELLKPENGFTQNGSATIEVQIKTGCCLVDVESRDEPDKRHLELECSICLEAIKGQDISTTPCGHMFCTKCIDTAIRFRPACPLCESFLSLDTLRCVYLPMKS